MKSLQKSFNWANGRGDCCFKADVCLRAFWHSKRKKNIAKAKTSKKVSLCCLYSTCYTAVGVLQWHGAQWLHIITFFSCIYYTHTPHILHSIAFRSPLPMYTLFCHRIVPGCHSSWWMQMGRDPKSSQDLSGSCAIQKEWFFNAEWWQGERKSGASFLARVEAAVGGLQSSGSKWRGRVLGQGSVTLRG